MENFKRDKIERVLGIYTKLLNGHVIDKSAESVNYGVNERSIQRDIDDIRNYLEEDGERSDVSTQWFMTEEKKAIV